MYMTTILAKAAFLTLKEADFSAITSLTYIGDGAFYELKIAHNFSSLTSLTHIGDRAHFIV